MRNIGLLISAGAAAAALAIAASRKTESESVPEDAFPESDFQLGRLREPVEAKARQLLSRSLAEGISLVVVQSFRSSAEQAALYAKGRTAPGPIVTNAKPGSSYHEYGLAFDVAVLSGGKPTWPNDMKLWNEVGALGESLGLKWGGRIPGLQDYGHFQLEIPGIGPGKSRPPEGPVS